jgi:hypothetical protein
MQSWKKIFSTNDVFEVYFYLERLHNEIELLENELNQIGMPQKIYNSILNKSKALTKNYNFNNNVEHFKLTSTELAQFYGFSFQGENEEIIEFDFDDDLEVMLLSLEEFQDKEIKLIFIDIISSFNRLQTLPKITGKIGLEESFKEIYCKIHINIDNIKKAPKEYKNTLIKLYSQIDKTFEFAQKWLSRGENLLSIIDKL